MWIEVAYAHPDEQYIIRVELPETATVGDAIEQSGILETCPQIDLQKHAVGVFGKVVKLEQCLHANDRVEIYRALQQHPMQARRNRARQQL